MLFDIFCKVIDNHGDIGVCWRLSVQLGARGHDVRLWVDDPSALAWLAPQGDPRVRVNAWQPGAPATPPGDVVIEAFGCELDASFLSAMAARSPPPAWFNLEYLTAESFAERSHGLPSPVLSGPAAGLFKRFFYPGFTQGTGGLLRETDLPERQARFDRVAWLRANGIDTAGGERLVSLLCYEPPALAQLLAQLAAAPVRTRLLVTSGRAAGAVRACMDVLDRSRSGWNDGARLAASFMPLLAQTEFDHLLWACDLNFVRGEDSLVRALWAGRPLVWNIYPQHDDAHHAKLAAFLQWLEAPGSLRDFHMAWNGVAGALPVLQAEEWSECAAGSRHRLLAQDDLVTRLLRTLAAQSPP